MAIYHIVASSKLKEMLNVINRETRHQALDGMVAYRPTGFAFASKSGHAIAY